MFNSIKEYLVQRKLNIKLFPSEICFIFQASELVTYPNMIEQIVEWCKEYPVIVRIIFYIKPDTPELSDY
ncbi:MAG TPA: hypothetical protein O0X14_00890, partial [Methanocorpusculum sp.]|nr:hypothetical protein [Methanocorpusculum sp.]